MEFLSLESFAGRVNETFDVQLNDDGRTSFVLVEARPLQSPVVKGQVRDPFALLFRSTSPILFPQQIYQMKNAAMGQVAIFLVPIARDREGFLYQAIFN
jgi:hypothetical protein